jgi:pimeloyl-ACP methyl ester carboxylesterase
MGGVAITQAAEARPHKISKLVYLTAFLLPSGRSLIEEAQTDVGSAVLPNLAFAPDNSFATVKPEAVPGLFYADCSSADVGLAQTLLVPQAAAPFMTPVQTTAERWGSVARVYIECTEDKAISLPAQRAMVARLPCEKVLTLTTSHSPFFSAPEALTRHLLSV